MANLSDIITPSNILTDSNTKTLTNKTWNSNTIAVAYGGTGLTSLGTANQVLAVNAGGTALEYQSAAVGSVTSVDVSGGTTGLTTSGGPVTSSGTVTLAGTLGVANGGTGSTSLTSNNVILGNGTSAVQAVAPGTSGNVLTSNGTTWQSSAAPTGAVTPLELTLISGSNFSSGSASQIEFTSLSSSYDYYLLFSNDLNMGGSVNPSVTLSSNNGSSYGFNIAGSGNSRSFGLRSNGSWSGESDSDTTRIWTNSNYVTAYTYIWGMAKSQQVYFTTYYYSGRENAGYYGWQNGRANNSSTNINALKYQFGGTATSGAVYLYGVTI